MKCPYCEYEHGWSCEQNKDIQGEKGDFFQISNDIVMVQTRRYESDSKRNIVGCPKCNKLFMEHSW